jgi:hypothetical protein
MADIKMGSLEKNTTVNLNTDKAWSPPQIKHLSEVNETETGGATNLDGVGTLS